MVEHEAGLEHSIPIERTSGSGPWALLTFSDMDIFILCSLVHPGASDCLVSIHVHNMVS